MYVLPTSTLLAHADATVREASTSCASSLASLVQASDLKLCRHLVHDIVRMLDDLREAKALLPSSQAKLALAAMLETLQHASCDAAGDGCAYPCCVVPTPDPPCPHHPALLPPAVFRLGNGQAGLARAAFLHLLEEHGARLGDSLRRMEVRLACGSAPPALCSSGPALLRAPCPASQLATPRAHLSPLFPRTFACRGG